MVFEFFRKIKETVKGQKKQGDQERREIRSKERPVLEGARNMTTHDFTRALWLSYMFSQGLTHAQYSILKFVSPGFLLQDLSGEQREQIFLDFVHNRLGRTKPIEDKKYEIIRPENLEGQGLHRPTARTGSEGNIDEVRELIKILTTKSNAEVPTPGEVFLALMNRDHYWKGGRVGPEKTDLPKDKNIPLRDLHFSFVVHYIIRGKKDLVSTDGTVDQAFLNLLGELRKVMPDVLNNDEYNRKRFLSVILYYNMWHPETRVTKKELKDLGLTGFELIKPVPFGTKESWKETLGNDFRESDFE